VTTEKDKAGVNIIAIKSQLLQKFPEMGVLMQFVQMEFDESLPAAAAVTFPNRMIVNPQSFNKMPPSERLGVSVHEALHLVFNHHILMYRRFKNAPPEDMWKSSILNIAADILINHMIRDDMNLSLPNSVYYADVAERQFGVQLPDPNTFHNVTVDQLYYLLLNSPKAKSIGESFRSDIIGGFGGEVDEGELSQAEREWRQARATAEQMGKYAGTEARGDSRFGGVGNPDISWQELLQFAIASELEEDIQKTYRRPNRRAPAHLPGPKFLYPSNQPPRDIIRVLFVVDTSGSIGNDELETARAVILQADSRIRMKIISHDTQVYETDLGSLDFQGGGGTDMRPVFDYIHQAAEEGTPFDLVVWRTDGYGTWPTEGDVYRCHEKILFLLSAGEYRLPSYPNLDINFNTEQHKIIVR
jgi:predicted metal-dependent peptidase